MRTNVLEIKLLRINSSFITKIDISDPCGVDLSLISFSFYTVNILCKIKFFGDSSTISSNSMLETGLEQTDFYREGDTEATETTEYVFTIHTLFFPDLFMRLFLALR